VKPVTRRPFRDQQADEPGQRADGDRRPIPDPTALTTAQLRRELASLREVVEARLDGMDRATELLSEGVNRTPTEIEKQIKHLRELNEEKFQSVALQFVERDVRTAQASTANGQALNAALQAAKELVTAQGEASAAAAVKSETSFTKQIDQIGTIIQTLEKSMDARLTEIKERIDRGEGQSAGAQHSRTEDRLDRGSLLALLAVLVSVAAIVTAIALHH
jgi:hypothetical protein